MGLDQYLMKKKEDQEVESLAYWRKVNQVHGWFVRECGEGVDECQQIDVPIPKLIELRQLCKNILADNSIAESVLPTVGGFFFGNYEYDEWYFRGIEETYFQLDKVLKELHEGDEVIYQASW